MLQGIVMGAPGTKNMPFRVERGVSHARAAALVREIGAVYHPNFSTQAKHYYWSASMKTWVLLEREGSGGAFRLSFFRGCDC